MILVKSGSVLCGWMGTSGSRCSPRLSMVSSVSWVNLVSSSQFLLYVWAYSRMLKNISQGEGSGRLLSMKCR